MTQETTAIADVPGFVSDAVKALFIDVDASAVDRFFADTYKDHALPGDTPSIDGLREFMNTLPENFGYQHVRAFGDESFVFTQGIYSGFGPEPQSVFDIWRVENGKIVEHWDLYENASND
ncbi:nuclear transport factor 2 family protein [Paenarthrobacter sp. NPDC058040]|uniref:nuclear transport factor 2 family protein n=1 Tax=unclassified Paenarthrobacter TaxID=2634190 RepID=UPI0036DDBBF1